MRCTWKEEADSDELITSLGVVVADLKSAYKTQWGKGLNPLPTNDAHVASWTLHKPLGI